RSARWILREAGSGTRQAFDRALHGLLPELHITLELQHTEAIKRAVEAGLGIGCLSLITLGDAFKRGSLIRLSVPQRDFSRQLYLIVHKQKYRSAGINAWIEMCRQALTCRLTGDRRCCWSFNARGSAFGVRCGRTQHIRVTGGCSGPFGPARR